jgi:hypothetical protein
MNSGTVLTGSDGVTSITFGTRMMLNAISGTLYDNLSFNFIRDIAPVASAKCPLCPISLLEH